MHFSTVFNVILSILHINNGSFPHFQIYTGAPLAPFPQIFHKNHYKHDYCICINQSNTNSTMAYGLVSGTGECRKNVRANADWSARTDIAEMKRIIPAESCALPKASMPCSFFDHAKRFTSTVAHPTRPESERWSYMNRYYRPEQPLQCLWNRRICQP